MAAGAKGRKIGRNKPACLAYKNAQKHEKSHIRRLLAHVRRYGLTDETMPAEARKALAKWVGMVPGSKALAAAAGIKV